MVPRSRVRARKPFATRRGVRYLLFAISVSIAVSGIRAPDARSGRYTCLNPDRVDNPSSLAVSAKTLAGYRVERLSVIPGSSGDYSAFHGESCHAMAAFWSGLLHTEPVCVFAVRPPPTWQSWCRKPAIPSTGIQLPIRASKLHTCQPGNSD